MNQLQIFNNQEFGQVRTLEENGKIIFCGSDVAKALGYSEPHKAINRHCKGGMKCTTPTNGGKQEMLFIPEGDLYRLIANSKLPTAEKFESWVFDEVLPSIRKHGAYMTEDKLEEVLLNPDLLIKLAQELKDERALRNRMQGRVDVLNLETKQQKQIIGELKPKADYTDRILNNKGLVSATQIAKDYGMSGQAFNGLLHRLKVQYKQSDQWLLYSKHHGKGYTHSETIDITRSNGNSDVKMNTKWTQKGRIFIYQLLKENGYLPIIEQAS